jgi:hypothetical protein
MLLERSEGLFLQQTVRAGRNSPRSPFRIAWAAILRIELRARRFAQEGHRPAERGDKASEPHSASDAKAERAFLERFPRKNPVLKVEPYADGCANDHTSTCGGRDSNNLS